MIRAYTASAMTGRPWAEIVLEAATDKARLAEMGILALDPVLAEVDELGYVPRGVCGVDNVQPLGAHWARDKRMMRWAHVLIDRSPLAKSQGIEKEIGYFRYFLFSPVLRVFGSPSAIPAQSIMHFEDDYVAGSLEEAAMAIRYRWGSRWKRLSWRVGVYAKYWRRGVWHKLERWFL